jgi:succinylglutamate desuccinylase
MTVYVDDVRHSFGRMTMCHMWADSEDELHAMADRIGIQRKWFQQPPKASWKHYDISLGKKALALELGAVLTDLFGPVEHRAKRRIASGDPTQMAHGQRMLEHIARSRALRGLA